MPAMRTYRFAAIHPTSAGPWADEPDKAQWVDDATDLDCLIVRNRSGALCGYVGVPADHPWHGRGCDVVDDVRVYGGLTFANFCQDGDGDGDGGDGPSVCHVPEAGRPADVWWFGFDCGHAFDLAPNFADLVRSLGLPGDGNVYRDFAFVQREVSLLAAQVASHARPGAAGDEALEVDPRSHG